MVTKCISIPDNNEENSSNNGCDIEFFDLGEYGCKICKYHSDVKSNYLRHIKSKKHILTYMNYEDMNKICVCGFSFENSKTASDHKMKCNYLKQYFKTKELYKRFMTQSFNETQVGFVENSNTTSGSMMDELRAVSYTHLTLPTILRV